MLYFAAQIALVTCVGLVAQEAPNALSKVPHATRLEPRVAKPGTVLTVTGVELGKTRIEEVYLTDHRFDMKVKVIEQTDQSLKIRIPPFVKAGRHQLLLLTSGQNPAFLEQPVFVVVELEEEAKTDTPKIDTPKTDTPKPAPGDKSNNDKPDQF